MGIADRPYIGTWQANNQRLVQHSPDALVYLNGDTSLPGCGSCNGRIDFQKFITSISAECGVEPGGASGNISMSIPHHFGDSILADGNFLLRAGLEVHIYMKGYFPYHGLYEEAELMGAGDIEIDVLATGSIDGSRLRRKPEEVMIGPGTKAAGHKIPARLQENATVSTGVVQVVGDYWSQGGTHKVSTWVSGTGGYTPTGHEKNSQHHDARAVDLFVTVDGKRLSQQQVYVGYTKLIAAGKLPRGGLGYYGESTTGSKNVHYDWRGYHNSKKKSARWYYANGKKTRSLGFAPSKVAGVPAVDPSQPSLTDLLKPLAPVSTGADGIPDAPLPNQQHNQSPVDAYKADLPVYPYYHCFHGVVTTVDQSYGPGTYTVTLNCASMLHFWSHQNVITNAATQSGSPRNSPMTSSKVGNKFANMTPYGVIYNLYHEEQGAVASHSFTLDPRMNRDANSSAMNDSLWHLSTLYWEKRFTQKLYGLRMHGVSGEMWSAAQQAVISKMGRGGLQRLGKATYKEQQRKINDPFKDDPVRQRARKNAAGELIRGASTLFATGQGMNAADMIAFSYDIGQFGEIAVFDSQYSSKLDIATSVAEAAGYEFYQDVDGDLVFKPPFYNLDTTPSKVYVIEDVDIIDMSMNEREPAATYMVVNGARTRTNLKGLGTNEGILANRAVYIDWRLVGQFGWREATRDVTHIMDKNALWMYAVSQLAEMNKDTNSGSVTIPLRPEIRPGFPVYIRRLDCYYYNTGVSHSMQFGSQCNTTLTLTAKRAKFFAPGSRHKEGIEAIDLSNMYLPSRPLEVLDTLGHPRLSGFPNVVMALDPDALNPLFAAGGADSVQANDPGFLKQLIKRGRALGVLQPAWDGRETKTQWEKGPWQFASGNHTYKVTMRGLSHQKKKYTNAQNKNTGNAQKKPYQIGDAENPALKAALEKEAGALYALISEVQEHYMAANPDLPEPNSTAALLDVLHDRKASLNNGDMPGQYRYYSCAHPDPAMQGQRDISSDSTGYKVGARATLDTPGTATGYVRHPPRQPNGFAPEAALGDIQVTAGIRIGQPAGSNPRFKVVPTSHIMSASLGRVIHSYTSPLPTNTEALPTTTIGAGLQAALVAKLLAAVRGKRASTTTTIASLLEKPYERLRLRMEATAPGTHPAYSANKLVGSAGASLDASTATVGALPGSTPPAQRVQGAARQLAVILAASQNKVFTDILAEDPSLAGELHQRGTELIAAVSGKRTGRRTKRGGKVKERKTFKHPLILPVSDADGYTHFGGFQYGRGLDIQPGGTFEQLSRQDPLKHADYKDVEAAVKGLSRKDGKIHIRTSGKGEYLALAARLAASAGADLGLSFDYTPGGIKDASTAQQGQFNVAFRNWVANSFNSEHKVVAANAAVSLATLQSHVQGATCSCKGAEASLELLAFGAAGYVGVAEGGDAVTQWVGEQMLEGSEQWAAHQKALRGEVVAPHNRTLAEAKKAWDGATTGMSTSLTALQEATRTLTDRGTE